MHALKTFTSKATQAIGASDEENGRLLIDAISAAVEAPVQKKYDMRIQKEISELQVSILLFVLRPIENIAMFYWHIFQ